MKIRDKGVTILIPDEISDKVFKNLGNEYNIKSRKRYLIIVLRYSLPFYSLKDTFVFLDQGKGTIRGKVKDVYVKS